MFGIVFGWDIAGDWEFSVAVLVSEVLLPREQLVALAEFAAQALRIGKRSEIGRLRHCRAGRMLYERLLRTGRTDKPNQFHKAGHTAQDQARDIDPVGVQPVIKASTDEPTNEGGGGKNHGKLTVAGKLYQDILFA